MGRIRTVKPEWMEDESMLRAGSDARVLSVCLILLADDHGRGRFVPQVLASQCFPFEESSRVFREALASLLAMGFVGVYTVRNQRYFQVSNWTKHQKVDKPSKSRCPDQLGPFENVSREFRETLAPDPDQDLDPDPDQKRESTLDPISEIRDVGTLERTRLRPMPEPRPGQENPEPTFLANARRYFGERFDRESVARMPGGCSVDHPWLAHAGRNDHALWERFESECRKTASNHPGIDLDEVGASVISQFFSIRRKELRSYRVQFLVGDYGDLARDSERLAIAIRKARGAA